MEQTTLIVARERADDSDCGARTSRRQRADDSDCGDNSACKCDIPRRRLPRVNATATGHRKAVDAVVNVCVRDSRSHLGGPVADRALVVGM